MCSDEVKDINLNLFVDFDSETTKHEMEEIEGRLLLVSFCDGGHVQSYADLEKLLQFIAKNNKALYMKFVTTEMMRNFT